MLCLVLSIKHKLFPPVFPITMLGSRDLCMFVWYMLSHSVVSDSLQTHGLQPARLLCPWDFPGKNSGVGCHFLLQNKHANANMISVVYYRREWVSELWQIYEMEAWASIEKILIVFFFLI